MSAVGFDSRRRHLEGAAGFGPGRALQRQDALERGNAIRMERSRIRQLVKAGEISIDALIMEPSWSLWSMRIFELLDWAPCVGSVKVNKILRRADVWPLKECGSLTIHQRQRILRELKGML